MEYPITNDAAGTVSDGGESFFHNVPPAPDVPVYAVMAAYKDDPNPNKLNLGMGVYRTEDYWKILVQPQQEPSYFSKQAVIILLVLIQLASSGIRSGSW